MDGSRSLVINTPYRSWKIESFEGGVRTPLIAFWPKGMKVKKGNVTNQPGHVMDFMATFIELAKAKYPTSHRDKQILPIDGLSLAPIFESKKRQGHVMLFNEHNNRRYARQGNWKLVSSAADSVWQLFNLANQPNFKARDRWIELKYR